MATEQAPDPTPTHGADDSLHIRPLTDPDGLRAFYADVLAPSFPQAELVDLDELLEDVAAGRLEVLAATQGDDPAVVAGAVGRPPSRPHGPLLLTYLASAPGHRGGGIGHRLAAAAVVAWTERHHPSMFLGEIEHPGYHRGSEATGDPLARVRFYARLGTQAVDVPYFQPGLGPGAERVPAMVLVAFPDADVARAAATALRERGTAEVARSVPADEIVGFLTDYLVEQEGSLGDDGAVHRLLDAAAGEPAGSPDAQVRLVLLDQLDRVRVGLLAPDERHAPEAPDPSAAG